MPGAVSQADLWTLKFGTPKKNLLGSKDIHSVDLSRKECKLQNIMDNDSLSVAVTGLESMQSSSCSTIRRLEFILHQAGNDPLFQQLVRGFWN